MHILLTAATPFEIQPTLDYLAATPPPSMTVTPLVTGVGSLPTTWSLMRQIGSNRPRLIIQAGIAGCFTGRMPGEVVAIQKETLADLGVWEDQTFRTLFDLRLANPDSPPFTNGQLVNPYRPLLRLTGLDLVPSLTVNEITTDPVRIKWYQQNTDAVVESMEGGGLHYVCLQENIPFVQLRAISNDIGVRDKTKWDIRSAIASLNTRLTALLDKLNTTGDDILQQL
ncbi:MAG: futalosine hydrolase [Bacteroidetes bacterium]|nr:futalosine hydrolase [Bacteroidota bacterium]